MSARRRSTYGAPPIVVQRALRREVLLVAGLIVLLAGALIILSVEVFS